MESSEETVVVTCCDCGQEFEIRCWVFEVYVEEEDEDVEFWCFDCSEPPEDLDW